MVRDSSTGLFAMDQFQRAASERTEEPVAVTASNRTLSNSWAWFSRGIKEIPSGMKRIRQLDSVRGIAVLLVLIHNTDIYPSLHLGFIANNGWMGVDLFFVLSGFLITGILVDTKRMPGYFKNFYSRRCLRIWPLYFTSILFMFVAVPLLRPSDAQSVFGPRSAPWWAFPLFLQNFLVRIPTQATGLLGVSWSLAVEEQFYLAWPLVVQLCSESRLQRISLGVIFLSPVLRLCLLPYGIHQYSNTFCRLDGLMAGAFLAVLVRSSRFIPSHFVKAAWAVLLASVPLALMMEALLQRWIVFSLVALASSAFVFLALFSENGFFQAVLKSRFLMYTGTVSFGIYLLEKIPLDVVRAFNLENYPFLAFSVTTAMTFAMASLSWKLLERPFLRLKRFFDVAAAPHNHQTEAIVKVT
jgi:peptidoglycan/LPS O-acetylase OafA/YrhL